MAKLTRRRFVHAVLAGTAITGAARWLPREHGRRIVVVGGGTAGAAAALALATRSDAFDVVLVERDPTRLVAKAPPLAEGGAFSPEHEGPDHQVLAQAGVQIMIDEVGDVDWSSQRVQMIGGRRVAFDHLLVAPGTAPVDERIPGLDPVARHRWPAAWGGIQEARRLQAQLTALPGGGHAVLRLPEEDIGHPEVAAARAVAIAAFLRDHKPDSRLTVLDGAERLALRDEVMRKLGQQASSASLAWHTAREGGRVVRIDAERGQIETTGGFVRADVVNFVVPRQAGQIAVQSGLADASGWCPCALDGRSVLRENTHILGDARRDARRTVEAALQSVDIALG